MLTEGVAPPGFFSTFPHKHCRECLIKCIQMRVPIENGSGFFNQVSDFIKLPAAYRMTF